jgi:hypothetical protein
MQCPPSLVKYCRLFFASPLNFGENVRSLSPPLVGHGRQVSIGQITCDRLGHDRGVLLIGWFEAGYAAVHGPQQQVCVTVAELHDHKAGDVARQ